MEERLGRYILLHPLAAGGMGEVFLAEHTGISGFAKRVALKRIRPELVQNSSYLELFLNEARLGSFLNHPNIVHIFDVGYEGDQLWLVMEYVDGVDLKRLVRRARLTRHPLSYPVLATLFSEVLLAIEAAHQGPVGHGPIIHRDLSPENILIARTGAVKVLDFGLAKYVPESEAVPSMEGQMIFGKLRYMPPEQLRGRLIDTRADLFTLGVVLYEAISGKLPFGTGDANRMIQTILKGPPPSPTALAGRPDPALDAIVFHALQVMPSQRYASASEMRTDLLQYLLAQPERSLPKEDLRQMLKRPDPSRPQSEHAGPLAHEPEGGTELQLAVAERCGKCGGTFKAHLTEGMILDRCTQCDGIWMDHFEIQRLIGEQSEAPTINPSAPFNRAPMDAIRGSCPIHRVGLIGYEVPGKPAFLEICPHCHGIWFDQGEMRLLTEPWVAQWLRQLFFELTQKEKA